MPTSMCVVPVGADSARYLPHFVLSLITCVACLQMQAALLHLLCARLLSQQLQVGHSMKTIANGSRYCLHLHIVSNIKRQTNAGKFLGKRNFLQFWLLNFRVSPSYFCNHSNDFTGIWSIFQTRICFKTLVTVCLLLCQSGLSLIGIQFFLEGSGSVGKF